MADENKPACITCVYAAADYRLECRVKPPSPNYKSYGRMFPIVEPDDWCGRYKARSGSLTAQNGEDDLDDE